MFIRWGVARKASVVADEDVNRSASAWPAKAYTVLRKFVSRKEARAYKANPPKSHADKAMYIIDLNSGHVVR